jgi:hypothetical protein
VNTNEQSVAQSEPLSFDEVFKRAVLMWDMKRLTRLQGSCAMEVAVRLEAIAQGRKLRGRPENGANRTTNSEGGE